MARRMSAVAALLWLRTNEAGDGPTADPGYALITGFARTSAEVGAAMNMSSKAAKDVVAAAEALDSRLPEVAKLLAAGKVDWATVALIVDRTELVDWGLMDQIDPSLAEQIGGWGCWSRKRIINAVDAAVIAADPDAAKERRVNADTEPTSPSPSCPTVRPGCARRCPHRQPRWSTSASRKWRKRCATATRAPSNNAASMRGSLSARAVRWHVTAPIPTAPTKAPIPTHPRRPRGSSSTSLPPPRPSPATVITPVTSRTTE